MYEEDTTPTLDDMDHMNYHMYENRANGMAIEEEQDSAWSGSDSSWAAASWTEPVISDLWNSVV